jgi:addiction module HigA family antidote
MSEMFNPPHPGRVLKNTVCREDGGMSVSDFAKLLKVSRVSLSRVLNCRAAISPQLALRLQAALPGSAQSWLNMQMAYDLWQAKKKRQPKIERIDTAA